MISAVLVLASSVTGFVPSLCSSLNGRGKQFERKSGLGMCFALQKLCHSLHKTSLLVHEGCPHFHKTATPPCFAIHTRGDPQPSTSNPQPQPRYRGTSLMRNCTLLGPYRRPMPRVVGELGGCIFFSVRYPCTRHDPQLSTSNLKSTEGTHT